MRVRCRGAPDLMDADISFPLERLFDHYNMDHIPQERRLDSFQMRDLGHIRSYKAAVKIFGGPLSRRRVIIAPPMETPLKHRLGVYQDRKTPPKSQSMNSELHPQKPPEKKPSQEDVESKKEKQVRDEYQKWIRDRKKLRQDLNGIGLNEKWLQGKTGRTELESRVLARIKADKVRKPEELTIEEPRPRIKQVPPVPVMKIPSPSGLQILDEHLHQKKIRLLDLFRLVDKDKNWAVSKDEFAKCIKEAQLDINEKELEDLVISLDSNLTEEVDYAELAQGMAVWKRERRDKKRESLQSGSSSPLTRSRTSTPVTSHGDRSQSSSRRANPVDTTQLGEDSTVDRLRTSDGRPDSTATSSDKSKSGSTPRYLEPPPSDTRLEQMILSSDEAMVDLRKHDQVVLARLSAKRKGSAGKRSSAMSNDVQAVIKTGNKAIDNHCKGSTLGGEVGQMVDHFRQQRLKEYYDVVHMCEQRGVPLTPQLLERVLLYPPDHHSDAINHRVTQPGVQLISSRFTTSPKPARVPLEVQHKGKMKRTKSGKLLIDSRHIYPPSASIAPSVSKETLSTGRALISRRVDCWMSYEEYDKFTGHLAIRYKQLHDNVDDNAFWPGRLLDKLRLCLPESPDQSQAIFYNTRQPKRFP